jgi:hypothetical protein
MQVKHLFSPVRARDALTGEKGATTLENVIIFSLIITIFALGLHFGLQLHADNIAHQAAQLSCNNARAYNSTAEAGTTVGDSIINSGRSPIENGNVSVSRTATMVTATVTGQTHSFVPGLVVDIRQVVSCPVERWVN